MNIFRIQYFFQFKRHKIPTMKYAVIRLRRFPKCIHFVYICIYSFICIRKIFSFFFVFLAYSVEFAIGRQ